MKTYIGSDFHIGSESTNYYKLISFFEIVKNEADRFIICGDCLDLWRCPIGVIKLCEPYKSAYDKLLEVAETIPTIIIPGNHDYNIGSLNLPNIEIRKPFHENDIFYTHGWEFDVNQRFGSYFYGVILKYFPYLYQQFFKSPSEIIENEYDEKSVGDPIHAEANKFACKHQCAVVMGHTHDPVINDRVVDCGDFIDSLSYCIINDGFIDLYKLRH